MNNEQQILELLAKHQGGIGSHLSEALKQQILESGKNEAENLQPFDNAKLCDAIDQSLQRMPIAWLIEQGYE